MTSPVSRRSILKALPLLPVVGIASAHGDTVPALVTPAAVDVAGSLRSAIYRRLKLHKDLASLLPGSVWHNKIPPGAALPAAAYHLISSDPYDRKGGTLVLTVHGNEPGSCRWAIIQSERVISDARLRFAGGVVVVDSDFDQHWTEKPYFLGSRSRCLESISWNYQIER